MEGMEGITEEMEEMLGMEEMVLVCNDSNYMQIFQK